MVAPRLTVLMPVCNAEAFVREAIDSVLAQSFKPFEFLIIDDGSQDSTPEIVGSYRDPRIRFIRNIQKLGLTATLNKGITLASCELIARMDAKAVCHPQRLQKQYGYMKRNPECAMVSSWAREIDQHNNVIRFDRRQSSLYSFDLTFECCVYSETTVFRKSALQAVGLYALRFSPEHDLFWRIATKYRIGNLSEALVDRISTPEDFNKRMEYENSSEGTVMRNIRYYLGDDCSISRDQLECLRNNIRPLILNYHHDAAINALQILDRIAEKMISRCERKSDRLAIQRALRSRRTLLIHALSDVLPSKQSVELLLHSRDWNSLLTLGQRAGLNAFGRWATAFKNLNLANLFRAVTSATVKNT